MLTIELTQSIIGKNGVVLPPGTVRDFPEEIARLLIEKGTGRTVPPKVPLSREEIPEHPFLPSPPPETEEGGIPSLRDVIEGMLADGPRPYSEILAAVEGNEDSLREAIRSWPELVASDDKGTWTWKLSKSMFNLRGPVDKIPRMRARQNLFGAFR